jgi:DNA segregation ATPase FtsK/SpoIIIE-like protein
MSEAKQASLTDTSGRSHPLYAEACTVVRKHKKGSISLVQRHLRIGWNTASMLLEAMVGDVIAEMPPTTKMLAKATEAQ